MQSSTAGGSPPSAQCKALAYDGQAELIKGLALVL
jgi:hypothetical protein